jgi:uncharacterized membrane protein YhaH (DUF805 family)
MKRLFFTFEGRMGRKSFWTGSIFLFLVMLAGFLVYLAIVGYDTVMNAPTGSRSSAIVSFMISLILFAPWLALLVKRLHDRGKSGWWSAVFLAPEYTYQFLDAFGVTGGFGRFNMVDYTVGGLYAAVTLWLLVELGFLKGSTGENAYGPDPLAP